MSLRARSWLRLAAMAFAIALAWQIAGFVFGLQHHNVNLARGMADDLRERLVGMSVSMFLWALWTPVVIFFSDRFPPARPKLVRNTIIVSVLTLAVAVLRALLDGWLPVVIDGLPLTLMDYSAGVVATFHTHLLLAILIVGIANLLRLEREETANRRKEARMEAELAATRLRQLRADLQPHFLFNTLNGVAALVHTDPAAAEATIVKLRELLRSSMATEGAREVRLSEELDFIARYLDIQKMRFAGKLTSHIHLADPALGDAAVPPLLLQPLVENSILHGVAKRVSGGNVSVHIDRDDDSSGAWLRLQVRDNGPGFDDDDHAQRASIGVPNARARLMTLYGERQSLRYERRGDAFVAEVRIPLRMAPA